MCGKGQLHAKPSDDDSHKVNRMCCLAQFIVSQEFFRRVYSRTERGRIFTEMLLVSENSNTIATNSTPRSTEESDSIPQTPRVSGETAKSTDKSS